MKRLTMAAPSAGVGELLDLTAAGAARSFARAFEGAPVTGPDRGWALVLADSYLDERIASVAGELCTADRAWGIVRPTGAEIILGPFFCAGLAGCWACGLQNLRRNRALEAVLFERPARTAGEGEGPLPPERLDSSVAVAAALTVFECSRFGALDVREVHGFARSIVLPEMRVTRHFLTPLPGCAVCSSKARLPRREGATGPGAGFPPAGRRPDPGMGLRSRAPEETVHLLSPHVSSLFGAVQELRRVLAWEEVPLFAYRSGHNFTPRGGGLDSMMRSLRSGSMGKGVTDSAARASAVCEALERHCGLYRGDEPGVVASRSELGGDAIHPNECMLFSDEQYGARSAVPETVPPSHRVPAPFDPEARRLWSPVRSLSSDAVRRLPAEYCYFGFPGGGDDVSPANSSGCAAGSTLEEALLQGLLELIERDAVSIWWYNRLCRPAVDAEALDAGFFARFRAELARLGRELWMLDLTHDLGVPVFAAVSVSAAPGRPRVLLGFGAHPMPPVAARRAAGELGQALAAAGEGADTAMSRGAAPPSGIASPPCPLTGREPYLAPAGLPASKWTRGSVSGDPSSIAAALRTVADVLAGAGLEPFYLDQSREEIPLVVVRTICPGLVHFWHRFGGARLYDVPVRLGWLEKPTPQGELNPDRIPV